MLKQDSPQKESEDESSIKITPAGILIAVAVLASFGIWIFGWIAPRTNTQIDLRTGEEVLALPDLFDDSTLSIEAEAICAMALEAIDTLPGAPDVNSPEERSVAVAQATEFYRTMLDDLAELEPATKRDLLIFDGWLSDWETVMDDRVRFTGELADGRDDPFVMTDRGGERFDRRITRVAGNNQMRSCSFPVDVG